ncbi:MAG: hypothetical protein KDD85_05670 [Parvularculaceae bacterium]|nr:hypothetical protein [Parvularculaceae bacterium]
MNAISSEFTAHASLTKLAIAGVAAAGLALAAPAHAKDRNIDFDKYHLLEQLIELDAEDIDDLRAELADAREEIADAIAEIEGAREEIKDTPGARAVLKIAFAAARSVSSAAINEALSEARTEIEKAERELSFADVSDAERAETQGVIDMLRVEIDILESSLDELIEALRA